MHSLVYRSKELELISESTARRAYMTLSSSPRRPQSIRDFPGERPELLKNAIGLLDSVDVTLTQIASALQMTPMHIRHLAEIDDPQPRITLVGSADDCRFAAATLRVSESEGEGADMAHRSAISGRYISNAAAARHQGPVLLKLVATSRAACTIAPRSAVGTSLTLLRHVIRTPASLSAASTAV